MKYTKEDINNVLEALLDTSFGYAFEFWPDNEREERFKSNMKGVHESALLFKEYLNSLDDSAVPLQKHRVLDDWKNAAENYVKNYKKEPGITNIPIIQAERILNLISLIEKKDNALLSMLKKHHIRGDILLEIVRNFAITESLHD